MAEKGETRKLPKSGWSNIDQAWPVLVNDWPDLFQIFQRLPQLINDWSNLAEGWSILDNILPNSTQRGRHLRSAFDRDRPILCRSVKFGQHLTELWLNHPQQVLDNCCTTAELAGYIRGQHHHKNTSCPCAQLHL